MRGVPMNEQESSYDYNRYRQLLAAAVDDSSRQQLIELLIRERARERLEAQRSSDRGAMTAETVAKVLGPNLRREHPQHG